MLLSSDDDNGTTQGYPRPQFRRATWVSLNGSWDFAIDKDASWNAPHEVNFDKKIEVPFSPETPRSGIGDQSYYRAVWYRRSFDRPPLQARERLLLHFGAVDHS